MNKSLTVIGTATVAFALAAVAPSSAFASFNICDFIPCHFGGVPQAPEIDPSTVGATIALLSGGVMMMIDRRRRRR